MDVVETNSKERKQFTAVRVPVLVEPGKITYGFKPYMVTCSLCNQTEKIAIWTKTDAKKLFIANGWKLSNSSPRLWLCPEHAG